MNKLKKASYKFDMIDRRWLNGFLAKKISPRNCECLFCKEKFHDFHFHGYMSKATEQHDVSGMGIRRCDCPFCGSSDKNRWLWWWINNKTHITSETLERCSVLHFAPERAIKNEIVKYNVNYISGDIVPGRADFVVDMTDIQFDNGSFDYVIASMVLEHIPQEAKAINELIRVLKPHGQAIVTVPIALDLDKTLEYNNVQSDIERIELYGQNDHVRLYGMDLAYRWSLFGANVEMVCPKMFFDISDIRKMGIQPEQYICILRRKN